LMAVRRILWGNQFVRIPSRLSLRKAACHAVLHHAEAEVIREFKPEAARQ
jgi:hypothetical protein